MFEKRPKCVVTFLSTEDAMKTEALCKEKNIPGRLIPVPVEISADCGMAFMMEPEMKELFIEKVGSEISPQGIYEVMMRG